MQLQLLYHDHGALQVWRGSLLLADLLLSRPQLVAARTIAELGAGCGLAGVAAARAGAGRVLATDLPPLLPQLQVSRPDTSPRSS
jgi:predicted nicotinamide N-methyase